MPKMKSSEIEVGKDYWYGGLRMTAIETGVQGPSKSDPRKAYTRFRIVDGPRSEGGVPQADIEHQWKMGKCWERKRTIQSRDIKMTWEKHKEKRRLVKVFEDERTQYIRSVEGEFREIKRVLSAIHPRILGEITRVESTYENLNWKPERELTITFDGIKILLGKLFKIK